MIFSQRWYFFYCSSGNLNFSTKGQCFCLVDRSGWSSAFGKQLHVQLIDVWQVFQVVECDIDESHVVFIETGCLQCSKEIRKCKFPFFQSRAWNVFSIGIDGQLTADKTHVVDHHRVADRIGPIGKARAFGNVFFHRSITDSIVW